ncbi:hypothetical protein GC209_17930 [bacterium]|nr:hypothetical protein [bacterium]
MSCCSDRRDALRLPAVLRAAPVVRPIPAVGAEVWLAYTGRADLALRGPESGRIYHVGPAARQVAADIRDVEALLRTGQFGMA